MNNKPLSLTDTLIITFALLILLGGAISLFGGDSLSGPTQVAMLLIGFTAALVGLKNGLEWEGIEKRIVECTSRTVGPNLIFLSIGSLIGALMLSGAVPTLLYAGLSILSPTFFYPLSCLICALVALSIGSSWTTAATIGVGLIGVSYGFALSPEITAGAIISGAYFGDKMSPLSETTNLAPAVAGSSLFPHIRHMMWVSVPSFVLCLIIFTGLGLTSTLESGSQEQIAAFLATLDYHFSIAWYNLLPIILLLAMAILKVPAFLAIVGGTIIAIVFAILFQSEAIVSFANILQPGAALDTLHFFKTLLAALVDGFVIHTDNPAVNDLLSRGGMVSMINMVWLVLCSMMMTGVLEKVGYIQKIMNLLIVFISSTGSLIATTMATCMSVNLLTGDQYLSLVLPGQMWKEEYKKRKLAAINLSRTLEDSGTITSPLIPWNACGVFMASTLGVATFAYLPFCFFNLINPLIALSYGFLNIKIAPLEEPSTSKSLGDSNEGLPSHA
ncbi:Na+/H+ antiporter NhaC [Dasania marina]|uniref:Na+/H+ antiporter NhaC n=1 Tax=Dasania marina TaxID=471499 RepID=UPI00036F2BFF|nr:Na+/H+ antiporter NhaC [Dasania marina]